MLCNRYLHRYYIYIWGPDLLFMSLTRPVIIICCYINFYQSTKNWSSVFKDVTVALSREECEHTNTLLNSDEENNDGDLKLMTFWFIFFCSRLSLPTCAKLSSV